jgi:Kelch motif/Bacterial Ig-like domain (group 3)
MRKSSARIRRRHCVKLFAEHLEDRTLPSATVTLTDNGPNPSTFGQSVSFTATVSASTGVPTGSVTFMDGNTPLGTASLGSPQPVGWNSIANMPTARDILAAATSPDGRIYAIGGEVSGAGSDGGGRTNAVEAYSPATNSWATEASLPIASDHVAAATGPDGKIYAIGGVTNYGAGIVQQYNPATNSWTTVANLPTQRWGLAAVTGPNGLIYALGGGYYSNSLNTVEAYNTATNTWTTEASMPTPSEYLASTLGPDGRIYAIGGYNESGGYGLSTVQSYDVYTNTWTTEASVPPVTNTLGAALGTDNLIYAIGAGVEAYNVSTNAWTTAPSLNTPRAGLAAVTGPDGRIYAIGGNANGGYLNTVEALNFDSVATYSTSSLSAGNHSITADYSGDANFASSTSSSFNQVVNNQRVNITSVTVNGDLLNATSSITSAVETVHSVEVTTAAPHGLYAGEIVQINGVGNSGFDGTYAVGFVIDATHFAYTDPTAGLGTSSGGTVVNAFGGAQRSMVDSITYQFNQPVTLGAGAITLTVDASQTGALPGSVTYAAIDDGHTWVVSFSGVNVIGNSIANGAYDITLNASTVTAVNGGGTLATSETDSFYRLFGDYNGDELVNAADNQHFKQALTSYNAVFDYNADGFVNAADSVQFKQDLTVNFSSFTPSI